MKCEETVATTKGILYCQKKAFHWGWHKHVSFVANIKWRRDPFKWKERKISSTGD